MVSRRISRLRFDQHNVKSVFKRVSGEGATELASLLSVNKAIQHINISNNGLTDKLLVPILRAIYDCGTVKTLKMGRNPGGRAECKCVFCPVFPGNG